jgi:hypothetical protein
MDTKKDAGLLPRSPKREYGRSSASNGDGLANKFSRRNWLRFAPLSLPLSMVAAPADLAVSDTFPMQPAAMVREMVTVSHGNFTRVRELVEDHPSLAKAAWDWGFGDWETALGAASHTGNRDIAEYLIAHGARPTLFSATMLGHLEVVKAFVAAQPGVQRIAGPHSISLLAHAKAGGPKAEAVLKFLEELGDAGATPPFPMAEEEMAALAGTYVFGTGAADRIEIAFNKGQLLFTRQGTVGRPIYHLGDRAFYPAGAAAVRVRFAGPVLTVHDPGVVLTARRI